MQEVFDRIERAVAAADVGPAGHFGMSEAIIWFRTLGFFEKAGVSVAALDMTDLSNPEPVRFDPDPERAAAAMLRMTQCILDGRIFLYFDKYELVAMIAKTTPRKWFRRTVRYTPFFAAPGFPVLTGPTYSGDSDALGWIEMRQRRAEEVMPSILVEAGITDS
ncbi:hypothetical protein ACFPOU_07755 [Massilia jejuensis]|uniref:Uncharacterized protein n=1 Tax=Massilia jejuensis TaxID=648894 RepID=A0ABW0PFE2_9BURK